MAKRIVFILLQLLVTTACIFFVLRDPQKRGQIAEAFRHADKIWIALGCVCYGVVEIVATVRWRLLLRVQQISLGWAQTGAIIVIGLFYNIFLPGLIGGDVLRLFYVFKLAPDAKLRASLSIAMDRLLGLFSIVFLALVIVLLRLNWLMRSPQTAHLAFVALAILGSGFVFVTSLFVLIGTGFANRLPEQIPFRNAILNFAQALNTYRKHLRVTVVAFLITIVAHLAYYTTFYCAGASLQESTAQTPALVDVVSIMPLVNTFTALPISIGGVGVRETLFERLLGNLGGVPQSIAILTASLGFAIQALWGLLGGAVSLLWRPRSASR